MPYKHGVYVQEQATSLLSPVTVSAGIIMAVGTAPVAMVDPTNINKPVLCHSMAEAVAAFGYVPPKLNVSTGLYEYEYSLCEVMDAVFKHYAIEPVILVNVLDPSTHQTSFSRTGVALDAKGAALVDVTGAIPSTVTVKSGSGQDEVTYVEGTDYTLSFNDAGQLVITSTLDGSNEYNLPDSVNVGGFVMSPSSVTAAQVVGTVNGTTGAKSGFELVEDIFPMFGEVPGTLIAPGYSDQDTVASAMVGHCQRINGLFKCVCCTDVPTGTVTTSGAVNAWKNQHATSQWQMVCWPMLALDSTVFHLSTVAACVLARTDSENGDVPYVSPSNKSISASSTVLASGDEVWLNLAQVNEDCNAKGVITALNFVGGWKLWGNRMACYPGVTDVKDSLISERRMFNWVANTLIQSFWQRVDFPLNKRQIQTIVDSANIWLNGLTARQYLLGGRVEFLESENPLTSLLDGIATFHVFLAPPPPNREIEFVLEYDVNYLKTLFD